MPVALLADLQTPADRLSMQNLINSYPLVCGVIIVGVNPKFPDRLYYWSIINEWERFGDPGKPEDPRPFFKTVLRDRWLLRVKHEFEPDGWVVELAFWIHPEAYHIPLERYQKMTGIQFVGSPRQ